MNKSHHTKGVILILCSCLAFSLMATLIRSVSEVNSFKITGNRFIVGTFILCTLALFGKIKLTFNNYKLLFIRGTVGGIAVFLFYLSISKLGIGKGTVLSQAYPIFAAIFSFFILKEKLSFCRILAILFAFFGIYLMQVKTASDLYNFSGFGLYEYLAVLSSVLAGFVVVLIKKLHNTDSTYAIFFAQCIFGFWIVMIPSDTAAVQLNLSSVLILISIGISATVAQLLMTEGYKHIQVTVGAILSMCVPMLNLLIGLFIFDEFLSIYQIIGATVIITCCITVVVPNKKVPHGRLRSRCN